MIYYNGFNMLVDVILMGLAGATMYRAGWIQGYGNGENDYREHAERAGDYYKDSFYDQEADK